MLNAALSAAILSGLGLVPYAAAAQTPTDSAKMSCKMPDNTAHNKKHNTTADQQGNSSADVTMTASIRKSILADKDLSTYAHNVKIITNNGMVTLRGPVHTQEEMDAVVAKATEVAGGSDKVMNRISVKPMHPVKTQQ